MLFSGWVFMSLSWVLVVSLTAYCFYKTLQADGSKK